MMFKKTKLYVAISLLVQSVSLTALFFMLWAKKRSIADAFLALATIEGSAGAYLLHEIKKEDEEEVIEPLDDLDLNDEIDINEADVNSQLSHSDDEVVAPQKEVEIPREDNVSTEEFNV